jgi:hypothetical protein
MAGTAAAIEATRIPTVKRTVFIRQHHNAGPSILSANTVTAIVVDDAASRR